MTPKIYPGMLDTRIEYFSQAGNVWKMCGGKVKAFSDTNHPELEKIIKDDPVLADVLSEMCWGDHFLMLQTLAECRFGGLNFIADFEDNGKYNHDFIDCPLRGRCRGENIVCQPLTINGVETTIRELEILRRCASDDKNTAIADSLNMPEGTFNVVKNETYKKLRIPTKQHLAITLTNEGLL